ncbi:MAG: SGNH/GDSL hydrolase family protein [bacterium]
MESSVRISMPRTSVSMPNSRRIAIMLVMFLLLYILCELATYLGLSILQSRGKHPYSPTLTSEVSEKHREILGRVVNGEAKYTGFSRDFGWTTLPYGENEIYQANSQGVRGTREYADTPPQDTIRIAAFGDSYVHGDDVPNAEAWSILLEQKASYLELMNFGVGGHGPDQGYLRYLNEGHAYSPDIVFIGFQTENINRVVNVFRPFYSPQTGNPLAKPYFKLTDKGIELNENPITSLSGYQELLDEPAKVLGPMGENDFHYNYRYKPGPLDWSPTVRLLRAFYFEFKTRYMNPLYEDGQYRTTSEAYQLVSAIIQGFHCDVVRNEALPVIVLFPNRADLQALASARGLKYEPLKEELLAAGYSVIDLAEAFRPQINEADLSKLINGHYTGQGNEIVANYLLAEIGEAGLFSQLRLDQAVEEQARVCQQ